MRKTRFDDDDDDDSPKSFKSVSTNLCSIWEEKASVFFHLWVRYVDDLTNCWSHCFLPISGVDELNATQCNLIYFNFEEKASHAYLCSIYINIILSSFKIKVDFVLFVMIFKVRRGEQWNVQELMMDLTLDISCVHGSQKNQQWKGCATPSHANLCKLKDIFSDGAFPFTKSNMTATSLQ